ncbi:MAG: hypothetical protein ACK4FB_02920 [Brevundimonas sp.]|uniref:hypothetical protein n=1 Tax=Brevundimonas sp. TaxID=1871086 RepID=UPI003919097D
MSIVTIGVYGLGSIGFRHLQGLGRLADDVRVVGVDPSPEARLRARQEWVGEGRFFDSPDAPREDMDLVILATLAKDRVKLLGEVLERHSPHQVIIEKVAFQSSDAFGEAERLLEKFGADASVNCPRRQWPLHQKLRRLLPQEGQFEISLDGGGWGLACNSVHFIDLLQFYSDQSQVSLVESDIHRLLASKRSGFDEAEGSLIFCSGRGSLKITCLPNGAARPIMYISGDGWRWRVDEASGVVRDEASSHTILDVGRPPYQSELTAEAISPLLEGRDCPLASLSESRAAHEPLLDGLAPAFTLAGSDTSKGLPIT